MGRSPNVELGRAIQQPIGLADGPRGVDPAWSVVAVGDYDGDGRADILWRNSSSGVTGLGNRRTGSTPPIFINLGTVSTDYTPVNLMDG